MYLHEIAELFDSTVIKSVWDFFIIIIYFTTHFIYSINTEAQTAGKLIGLKKCTARCAYLQVFENEASLNAPSETNSPRARLFRTFPLPPFMSPAVHTAIKLNLTFSSCNNGVMYTLIYLSFCSDNMLHCNVPWFEKGTLQNKSFSLLATTFANLQPSAFSTYN